MTQIEVDTMYTIQSKLREIADQLKIQNEIAYLRLRIANGGFANKEELNDIAKKVGL